MKRPFLVTLAAGIYTVVALLGLFVFVALAIYTREEFLMALVSLSFLPPLLSSVVVVVMIMLPGFAAAGMFAGKNWARFLFIAIATIDLVFSFLGEDTTLLALGVKLLYNGVIALCLFMPTSNQFFRKKCPEDT